MPFISIQNSPLARRSVELHYREFGAGKPLIFLHGGWGYHVYPVNKQLHSLKDYRVLVPDRSGYGLSTRPAEFGVDFHVRAAEEMFRFMDALGIRDAVLWGHSDGSVIAAYMGLIRPERCRGLVLEAFHFYRRKTASRMFFETMVSAPESYGERVCAVLAREHGDDYWRELLQVEGRTWLEIAKLANAGAEDIYDGGLGGLKVPTVLIHGALDPRTDPGEIDSMSRVLPSADIRLIPNGEHCPHSESKAAEEFTTELTRALAKFE